jgi:hypothetical protein
MGGELWELREEHALPSAMTAFVSEHPAIRREEAKKSF